ncbi:hypothetical protein F5Y13DRAFT_152690 [Hypoxylon sp. FL1857]|nr:hypothetical protein F5Y13DRAFT_152690 [Hypoxylon sp. FL1857]
MSTQSKLKEEPTIEYRTDIHTYDFIDLGSVLAHYGLGPSSPSRAILNLTKPKYNSSLAYPLQQFCPDKMLTGPNFSPHLYGGGFIVDEEKENVTARKDFGSWVFEDRSWKDVAQQALKQTFRAWGPITGNNTIGLYKGRSLPNELVPDDAGLPDMVLQKFFIDAMKASGNSPASSLSALLTLMSSVAYYELLPVFTEKGTAQVVTFEEVSYPQSWHGLVAVISLLGAHLLTCAVIIYIFLTRTRFTRLGNSWASVAQIYGAGTEDIMRNNTLVSDAEVEKLLLEKGQARQTVKVSLVANEFGSRCEPILIQREDKSHS